MSGVKQRRTYADYLNVSATDTEEYDLMGAGFTELDENPNAQTVSKRYINDKSNTTRVSGYDWTSPFNTDVIRSEKAVEYICKIGEHQLVGSEAETDYVKVDLEKEVAAPNKFEARKFRVAVIVSSFTNSDGEMTCSGELKSVGDMEIGVFDTTTKKFTVN